jgi:hypothetical protein
MGIRRISEHALGLTWTMDDALRRASHALAHEGKVWLVDPVDAPEALERAAALGEPAGVLQLFVAHERGGPAIAERLGVPFHKLPDALPGSPFEVVNLDLLAWKERALWWPSARGLIVGESIGTAAHYAIGNGPAGVHFLRRALPPQQLRSFLPEHLLVGHGRPLHGPDAAAALLEALDRARRDIPLFAIKAPRMMWGMGKRR